MSEPPTVPKWLMDAAQQLLPPERGAALGFLGAGFLAGVEAGRVMVGICGHRMPALVTGEASSVVCELPHGHAGWHGAPPGVSGPRWAAEPDVREVGRCFKTVDEWLTDPEFAGTAILDWDGWRTPDAPSRETPITRDEFRARLAMCTVRPRLVGEQGPEMVTVHARNCERCGAGFTTTIEHRLLCNECYRSDLAAGTTIHPQPEATDG